MLSIHCLKDREVYYLYGVPMCMYVLTTQMASLRTHDGYKLADQFDTDASKRQDYIGRVVFDPYSYTTIRTLDNVQLDSDSLLPLLECEVQ